jgi:hypothetical protein
MTDYTRSQVILKCTMKADPADKCTMYKAEKHLTCIMYKYQTVHLHKPQALKRYAQAPGMKKITHIFKASIHT